MQCKYENMDLDGVYTKCKSTFAKTDPESPYYEYCYGHALMLGLVPKEKQEERKEKISKTQISIKETEDFQTKIEKNQTKAGEVKKEQLNEATELYESIVGTDTFSLEDMLKDINKDKELDVAEERRHLFLLWWVAKPKHKSPKSLRQVAKLLGISEYRLQNWKSEQWFLDKVDDYRLIQMKLIAPFVDEMNLIQAMTGDGKSKDLLYRQLGNLGKNVDDEDPFGESTESQYDMARELSNIDDTSTGSIRTSHDEDLMAVEMADTLDIDDRSEIGEEE